MSHPTQPTPTNIIIISQHNTLPVLPRDKDPPPLISILSSLFNASPHERGEDDRAPIPDANPDPRILHVSTPWANENYPGGVKNEGGGSEVSGGGRVTGSTGRGLNGRGQWSRHTPTLNDQIPRRPLSVLLFIFTICIFSKVGGGDL